MSAAAETKKSAAKFLSSRVVAVRTELARLEESWTSGHPSDWKASAIAALRKDLADLESKLATVRS